MTHESETLPPAKVRLTDGVGPDERAKLDALLDHIYEYGTTAEGVLRLAAQLCEATRAAERERCAMRLEQAAAEYIASATDNKFLTDHGRALMTSASGWAQTMAGALRALGPNTEYVVWCPERGATKEDGRHINAFDPESAATRWAEWDDASSADYTIVGGTPAEVVVAEVDDGATEHRFTVTGETCAIYRARAAV